MICTENEKHIPKIIHYCWFGKNKKPDGVQKCIRSWEERCPDYEIIEWNENNFDVDKIPYTQEAYAAGKWAFVSDVARLYALINQGGIYLDTDVELIASFDKVLDNDAFVGFEGTKYIATAVIGSIPNNTILETFLNKYKTLHFAYSSTCFDETTNVTRLTELLLQNGLILNGEKQEIDGLTILPTDFFSPYDYINGQLRVTDNTIAIHWYSVSWISKLPFRKRLSQLYHRLIGKKRE